MPERKYPYVVISAAGATNVTVMRRVVPVAGRCEFFKHMHPLQLVPYLVLLTWFSKSAISSSKSLLPSIYWLAASIGSGRQCVPPSTCSLTLLAKIPAMYSSSSSPIIPETRSDDATATDIMMAEDELAARQPATAARARLPPATEVDRKSVV